MPFPPFIGNDSGVRVVVVLELLISLSLSLYCSNEMLTEREFPNPTKFIYIFEKTNVG